MQFLSGLEVLSRRCGARSVLCLCAVAFLFAIATGSSFGGAPSPAGFYVAPNGNDRNPGTLEQPVATLARAQQLMRASRLKTTYIRAGVYALPVAAPKACNFGATDAAVALTADDDGEIWSFYPPDGYDTAVLDGQSTKGSSAIGGGNGLGCAFAGKSIHDVQIVGLRFKRFLYSALWVDPATSYLTPACGRLCLAAKATTRTAATAVESTSWIALPRRPECRSSITSRAM